VTSLEDEFDAAMMRLYEQANDAGYNATYFLRMVNELGGVETAKRLINADAPSEGFTKLWGLGQLDLTVEALMTRERRFAGLLTGQERLRARKRLEDYGWSG
jgi:hypothetical protein